MKSQKSKVKSQNHNLKVKTKKNLGQNFLTSKEVVLSIRDAVDPTMTDVILEIGPGKGIITENLMIFAGKVIAVEKDRELVKFLKEKFKDKLENGVHEIIEGDILDFDLKNLALTPVKNRALNRCKVVGNIPYYITGAILKKFLGSEHQPSLMVLMMQKEVAERIVAKDDRESILSISVKAYGEPKIIKKVSKKLSSPQPKVDSAVLLIENISKNFFIKNKIDEKRFFELVKKGFSSKRKFLKNNLDFAGLNPKYSKLRAENLKLPDWEELYKKIWKSKNTS